ncbi:MAG: low molecular weight phosphatase family protein [Candidatus Bathyarchaeia archaeon]
MKILFVCFGNLCRSPMAEGIARKILGTNAGMESAGTHAYRSQRPTAEAVETMRDKFGIDISSHRSRNVQDLRIEDFDYIIPMDDNVHEELKRDFSGLGEKLMLSWSIIDPYGRDLSTYEEAAARIQKKVEELSVFLKNEG